ncbi:MAG: hypothetical protein WCX88_00860 [Patescibacteria group bacterium]
MRNIDRDLTDGEKEDFVSHDKAIREILRIFKWFENLFVQRVKIIKEE